MSDNKEIKVSMFMFSLLFIITALVTFGMFCLVGAAINFVFPQISFWQGVVLCYILNFMVGLIKG